MFKAVLVALTLAGQAVTEIPEISFPSQEDCEIYAREKVKAKAGPNGSWAFACPEVPGVAVESKSR